MLTARETHTDRISGLESGADDYVVKPFDPEEVVARARAVLRRVNDKVQQVLTCGHITIDETTRRVTVNRATNQPESTPNSSCSLPSCVIRIRCSHATR